MSIKISLMYRKIYRRKLNNAFKRFANKKSKKTHLREDYFIDSNKECCGNIENICRSCPYKDLI
jgi:hypothetical protein